MRWYQVSEPVQYPQMGLQQGISTLIKCWGTLMRSEVIVKDPLKK